MGGDILEFIRSCVRRGEILWTYHVNMRLKDRAISREAVLSSVDSYEIIEEYLEKRYLNSYLLYAKYQDEVIHIVVAVDEENENVRIITAYKPAVDKWDENLRKRRDT
jgi:hypothetical protein